jgi:transposase InsO family protein
MLSMGKSKYHITFTDYFSHYTHLTTMRTKDGALQAYKDYAAWAYTQHGTHIKRLHSDHSGEYTSGEFTSFLKEQGTE